jgi:hypothetical protein
MKRTAAGKIQMITELMEESWVDEFGESHIKDPLITKEQALKLLGFELPATAEASNKSSENKNPTIKRVD